MPLAWPHPYNLNTRTPIAKQEPAPKRHITQNLDWSKDFGTVAR